MIVVTHEGGDRLRITTGGHELFVDQPVADGGQDSAPTPTEMFAASLAACVAFYAERFLRRNNLATEGLRVVCDYGWAENPHRVGEIELALEAPGLTDARRVAFAHVIEHCTLHNTLRQPPAIRIKIAEIHAAAA